MNLDAEYRILATRLRSIARSVCKVPELWEEYEAEAALLMLRAAGTWNPNRGEWEDWVGLFVRNGLLDKRKAEMVRQGCLHRCPDWKLDGQHARQDVPEIILGLSKDATDLALTLTAVYADGPRYAMDRAKSQMYELIGWRRFWEALNELKTTLEA